MTSQLAISFDLHKPEFTCLARRDDPQTSHDAAIKVEACGKTAKERSDILATLNLLGPRTAKEIGKELGVKNYEISKRSGELVGEGKPCKYLHNERRDGCGVWALNSQCYRNADGQYVRIGGEA